MNNEQEKAEAGKVIKKETQVTAGNRNQNNPRKPDEPYQYIFALQETDESLLFKMKNYKVSVSIGLLLLHMRRFVCVFDTNRGPTFKRADVLDPTWLDRVFHGDMPEIRSASGTRLIVPRRSHLPFRRVNRVPVGHLASWTAWP